MSAARRYPWTLGYLAVIATLDLLLEFTRSSG